VSRISSPSISIPERLRELLVAAREGHATVERRAIDGRSEAYVQLSPRFGLTGFARSSYALDTDTGEEVHSSAQDRFAKKMDRLGPAERSPSISGRGLRFCSTL
jgi:hypothetical protein